MAIVAVIGGTFCHQEEVSREVAEKLGYDYLSNEKLLEETSARFQFPSKKLHRAMTQPPSVFNKFTHEKEQNVAYIRATLAEIIQKDNLVYNGFASLLIPKSLTHVLRVCLVATHQYRVAEAGKAAGMTEKDADKAVKKDEAELTQWSQHLFQLGPYDKSLYDVVIPMHTTSVEEAVGIVVESAGKPALKSTPAALKAAKDFLLAGQVSIALAKKGHDVEVTCQDGRASMVINRYTMRLDALEQELTDIAKGVPGVKSAQTRVGPGFHQPNIYFDLDVEMPKKVLLVDDERDFVHVLSERLQARSMESAVAYNGEEALSIMETDEPEVMVLDLKMPGIDGIETLRRVKRDYPDTQVIILTGHGSEREEALARELGAFAYLHKPVDIDVLAKTMKAAYRRVGEAKRDKEEGRK
jgi:two-component system response regulator CpxR